MAEISEAGQMTPATYQDNYEAWKELKLQYDFTSKYLHTTAKSIFGIAKFFDYAFDMSVRLSMGRGHHT
ncbi:MAG: hypothetical protein ACLU18_16140 [Bacteroides thetaiotaomicron]